MNIDPGSDVPLFVQIAEGIEEDIFTGSYARETASRRPTSCPRFWASIRTPSSKA